MITHTLWDGVYSDDPGTGYSIFKDTLNNMTKSCIPRAWSKDKRKSIFMNREAFRLKNNKRKLWAAYTSRQDDVSYARYVRCKNDLRRLTRNLRKEFERELTANLKDNPKRFWRYANSRTKTKSRVENLRAEGGELTTCDQGKAEVLNSFFCSLCTTELDNPIIVSSAAGSRDIPE